MKKLKFIEERKENNRLNALLMPTTMSKSEMRELQGGGYFCDAGCEPPGWTCSTYGTTCGSYCSNVGIAVCPQNGVAVCTTLSDTHV
ncbi:MAG: hypothetical protein LBG80_14650 [Bacteroidales bacterium]|jgi:hypothetical protein|nr:hypothetical protein [Bacteroidales bacterium]